VSPEVARRSWSSGLSPRVPTEGRTLMTCAGDVLATAGGEERHVLTMLATMMTVQGRPGLAD